MRKAVTMMVAVGALSLAAGAAKADILVGMQGPTTGSNAAFGDQMKRGFEELAGYLYRDNIFAHGCYLLTGTGVIPPADFTLHSGDLVRISIGIEDWNGGQADPCACSIVVAAKIFVGAERFAAHDGVGERELGVFDAVGGVKECFALCAEVIDQSGRRDDGTKNVFCARVAHDDIAVRGLGDDEANRHGVEDRTETSFATTQSLFGPFVAVDIFHGTVPTRDLSVFVASRGRAIR